MITCCNPGTEIDDNRRTWHQRRADSRPPPRRAPRCTGAALRLAGRRCEAPCSAAAARCGGVGVGVGLARGAGRAGCTTLVPVATIADVSDPTHLAPGWAVAVPGVRKESDSLSKPHVVSLFQLSALRTDPKMTFAASFACPPITVLETRRQGKIGHGALPRTTLRRTQRSR